MERDQARKESGEHRAAEKQPAAAAAGAAGVLAGAEQPHKVFYKTRLCERFKTSGKCAYGDGCTFAHGQAELRPPLPLPVSGKRSRLLNKPPGVDGGDGSERPRQKVCFEYRDKGTCRFGEKCNYSHGSAETQPGDARFLKLTEAPAGRSVMPPTRASTFSAAGSSSVYAPPAARAFPPAGADDDAAEAPKPTRLEILSRKKLSGIYGDWPF